MDTANAYYAFLNVSQDASTEEIRRAYFRLSRAFHPDRHSDPELHSKAKLMFEKMRQIYEVLSNPELRQIYDASGNKGLQLTGWEVLQRPRGPEELKLELERLKKLKQDELFAIQSNPSGSFVLHANASDIFQSTDWSDLPYVELRGLSLKQKLQTPAFENAHFFMAGNVESFNGVGSGSANVGLFYKYSQRLCAQASVKYDHEPSLCTTLIYSISETALITSELKCPLFRLMPTADAKIQISRSLSENCNASMALNFGSQTNVTTTLHFSSLKNSNLVLGCSVGLPASMVMAIYNRPIGLGQSAVQGCLKIGTMGVIVDCAHHQEISSTSSVNYACQFYYPLGIFTKLCFKRGNQTYTLNLTLAEHELPVSAIVTGLLMSVAVRSLYTLVLKPLGNRIANKLGIEKTSSSEHPTVAQRQEAEMSKLLMQAEAMRMVALEKDKKGLVIIESVYGCMESSAKPDEVVDVTVPLQIMVKQSKLIIPCFTSKSCISGFFDPCPGKKKKLKIIYLFGERLHDCIFDDGEPVALPKSSHLKSASNANFVTP